MKSERKKKKEKKKKAERKWSEEMKTTIWMNANVPNYKEVEKGVKFSELNECGLSFLFGFEKINNLHRRSLALRLELTDPWVS